ncbi:cell wall hydrolase [Sphingomonas sp. BGYR3]|uniref:cell wall hydrolase n=1 Tax=Sphingomonas sp. BGYR3 TaxID=2975483 RepID=UPI0021A3F11A|nr:cell wall hydrolase [Sphingomonas sp. BGYR3]MDG5488663.1 cell wall hydrolase [Sphingomonas sp. BGYR3]
MSFSARAAISSALLLGTAILGGASVPGRAVTPEAVVDKPLPVTGSLSREAVPMMGPSAEIVQPLPAETPAPDADDATDGADDLSFDTLAAAVEAQETPRDLDEELRCLATGIYFEAKGEPLSGQLAVAKVILNRTESGRFPRNVCSVLTQPGQFSFVRGGRMPSVNTDSRSWRTAVAVAQVATDDHWANPMPGALYFHARTVSPGWRLARLGAVGNHVFYR